MHATIISSSNVSAFLIKLWKLVEDPKCDDLICWNSTGTTFLIRDQSRFAKELLPLYFKHNNMASFIRQLNMYGFRKVVSVEQGALRMEKDEMEFQHMYFLKGHEYLLELIKRKVSIGKATEELKVQPEIVSKMIIDVKNLHGKQESLDTKLTSMKRENEALWREIASLRQQHLKQQQIVNKLIQFLLSLVHPNRSLGGKRKMALMLNDTPHSDTKVARLSRTISYDGKKGGEIKITAPSDAVLSDVNSPGSGAVIHDITDVDAEMFLKGSNDTIESSSQPPCSPSNNLSPYVVESPGPSASITIVKDDEVPAEPNKDLTSMATDLVTADEIPSSRVDFVDYIDNMQLELDVLKDVLSSGNCTIDTATLMGLFSVDDLVAPKSFVDVDNGKPSGNEIVGTELMQYAPNNLLELPDTSGVSFESEFIPQSPSLDEPLFDYVDSVFNDDREEPEKHSDSLNDTKLPVNLSLTDELDLLLSPQNSLKELIDSSSSDKDKQPKP